MSASICCRCFGPRIVRHAGKIWSYICEVEMLRAVRRITPTIEQRRAFFGFNITNGPHEPGIQSYRERKVLPYRCSDLYKIIADVESYSNFVPYCAGSRILASKVSQDGTTVMEAELTVGFLAFRESYVSTVTCRPHESVEAKASSSTPLFKSLTTTWRLQPVACSASQEAPVMSQTVPDQGPTLVTLDLAYAFANPMHASVSAAFFGQVSKLMVKAFEQRCSALYGPKTL